MLTHRFHWMGSGKSESAVAVLANFRDGSDFSEGSLRNRDYEQRRHIAQLIRERLTRIKEELGLIPTSLDREVSPESADSLFPTLEKLRSARDLAASVRNMLLCQGETYVSYIDGSSHRDLAQLCDFNERAERELESNGLSTGARPSEFSTTALERLLAKESVFRKRLDDARRATDASFVSTFVLPEGESITSLIVEEEEKLQPDGLTTAELDAQYRTAKAEAKNARGDYNLRAQAHSKQLLENSAVRAVCSALHLRQTLGATAGSPVAEQ